MKIQLILFNFVKLSNAEYIAICCFFNADDYMTFSVVNSFL